MAWTLEQIAAYLPQLSSPDEPIRYEMAGTRITAHWDVAHVAYVALLGGGTNHSYSYVFEDSRIKQPLFRLLEHAGYTQKRGFFGWLFG